MTTTTTTTTQAHSHKKENRIAAKKKKLPGPPVCINKNTIKAWMDKELSLVQKWKKNAHISLNLFRREGKEGKLKRTNNKQVLYAELTLIWKLK